MSEVAAQRTTGEKGSGEATSDAEARPAPRGRLRLFVVLVTVVVLAAVGTAGLSLARVQRESAQQARLDRAADRGPRVLVAPAARPSGERTITLPGDVRPMWQSTLYSKVNGYVAGILVDKGDRVRQGQVLARISSPETDEQVRSAEATLALRRRNLARVTRLAPTGYVSSADLDQATSELRSAEADYQRAKALQAYETMRAPFDGLVTARYVDPGALLTASSTGAPVVDLADPGRAHVYVYVGQDVAPFVRVGDTGQIALEQAPGVEVPARVVRIADAIDPRSRSMLVELALGDPPDGVRLVPGLFVHVALKVAQPPLPSVPTDALVSRGDHLQVATVRDRRLHFVDVVPGQTDGHQLQIRQGLSGGEVVALSPPSDLGEGAPVQPVEQGAAQAHPAPAQAREPGGGPPPQRGLGSGGQNSSG